MKTVIFHLFYIFAFIILHCPLPCGKSVEVCQNGQYRLQDECFYCPTQCAKLHRETESYCHHSGILYDTVCSDCTPGYYNKHFIHTKEEFVHREICSPCDHDADVDDCVDWRKEHPEHDDVTSDQSSISWILITPIVLVIVVVFIVTISICICNKKCRTYRIMLRMSEECTEKPPGPDGLLSEGGNRLGSPTVPEEENILNTFIPDPSHDHYDEVDGENSK